MKISTRAIEYLPQTREALFDFATSNDFAKVYSGFGPLPGMDKVWNENAEGGLKPGSIRNLAMTDGSTLREEILELERPSKLYYRLTGFKSPFDKLLTAAEGLWLFSPHGAGSRIIWTMRFECTSIPAAVLATPLVKTLQHQAMAKCLREIKAKV
jgi:hypothetical protein